MAIQNLLIRPKNRTAPARIRAEKAGAEATIWLYDIIDDWWGVNAGEFCKEVAALSADTVHLRINSGGGDVFGARAMIAALRGSGAHVIAHVDGVAASAATFIAVNCNEVRMAEGAFFMIHQAGTGAWGNAGELREIAELLDKVDGTIVADYVRRTGQDETQIRDWMKAETWFTAAEAKAAGFVDEVVAGQAVDNSAWDFSACRNAPKALLQNHETVPVPVVPGGDGEEGGDKGLPPDGALIDARAQAARILDVVLLSS